MSGPVLYFNGERVQTIEPSALCCSSGIVPREVPGCMLLELTSAEPPKQVLPTYVDVDFDVPPEDTW